MLDPKRIRQNDRTGAFGYVIEGTPDRPIREIQAVGEGAEEAVLREIERREAEGGAS